MLPLKTFVKEVPFFGNTEDDTHCVQACYRMILKYFEPSKNFSWQELDRITKKVSGEHTWPMAGLIWFVESGYQVEYVELFDFQKFIDEGKDYLIERYGSDLANNSDQKSVIKQEQDISKDFIKKVKHINVEPSINTIKDYLNDGFLVSVLVNYRAMYDLEGYNGHAIVVVGYDNDGFIVNDPGLPPREKYKMTFSNFIKIWSSPGPEENNITAIRPCQKN